MAIRFAMLIETKAKVNFIQNMLKKLNSGQTRAQRQIDGEESNGLLNGQLFIKFIIILKLLLQYYETILSQTDRIEPSRINENNNNKKPNDLGTRFRRHSKSIISESNNNTEEMKKKLIQKTKSQFISYHAGWLRVLSECFMDKFNIRPLRHFFLF